MHTSHSPTRARGRRTPTVRALEAELGHDVLVALLNENSPNPTRRSMTLRRRLEWAQVVARRRVLRLAA